MAPEPPQQIRRLRATGGLIEELFWRIFGPGATAQSLPLSHIKANMEFAPRYKIQGHSSGNKVRNGNIHMCWPSPFLYSKYGILAKIYIYICICICSKKDEILRHFTPFSSFTLNIIFRFFPPIGHFACLCPR